MRNGFTKIVYKKEGPVAWIILNNPERYNVLELDMRRELKTALEDAARDVSVRVVVLTGAGGNFCAGADIRAFLEWGPDDAVRVANELGTSMVLSTLIRKMQKTVLAVVEGYCLGGGFELAQACDLIIASEDAVFGQPEINIGLIPGGGGSQWLPRLIGEKRAKELIMTGERVSASKLAEMGLVNLVVSKERLEEAVKGFLDKLLSKPPLALAAAKEAINASLETNLSTGLRFELMVFSSLFATEDQKEGARAFLEKRKPVWKGR